VAVFLEGSGFSQMYRLNSIASQNKIGLQHTDLARYVLQHLMIMMKLRSSCLFVLATTTMTILQSSSSLLVVAAEETAYASKIAKAGIDQVKDHFVSEGYVLLRNFFQDQKPLLKELKNSSRTLFYGIFQEMYDKGYTTFPEHSRVVEYVVDRDGDVVEEDGAAKKKSRREYSMPEGRENGFQEIVMRNPGRYEINLVRYQGGNDKIDMDPLVNTLKGIVTALFGMEGSPQTKLNMDMSLIVSTADSQEQPWHTDGAHLDFSQHLPVHCLNIFIPLVNVPDERGPTEFSPKSHYLTRQPSPMKISTDMMQKPLAPELKVGDILIFDYRLLHRGKPNLSSSHRPYLVLTFSLPTFHDTYNWPARSLKD
jgi:predicted  nucleic acid-binding Zn-ribbon protein